MKHLRRNRTTSLSSPSPSSSNAPSVSAPIHLSATSAAARAAQRGGAPPETPLYARFTGARRGEDGSALKLKPLVSGPIALAPKRSATQVPAPPPLQQQKSSEGREERRKQRELDRAKSKAALKEGKEGLEEQAAEGEVKVEVGGQSAERPEVARMRSDETTVSGTSGSTTGLGRHGTRIEGERVLLPARKVTQKRVVADKSAGVEGRGEEAPGSSSKSADAPPMAKGEELQEGGDGPRKEQTGVRPAVGERVPLPARKVTRKRIFDGERHIERDAPLPSSSSSPNNRPTLESSRAHSPAPASSNLNSNSKEADAQSGRANNEVQKQTGPVEHARTQTRTRTNSPEPQASSSSPIVFPANASPIPSPAAGLSATNPGAVVVIDQEGGEDKFSRPKRARMHTLATTSPASNTERPMSPSRPAIEPSKSSEGAKTAGSTAPPAATSTSTSKPAAAPTLTSHPSTSSVATTGGPPRRRKYSLRAAFGLPIARSTSDSHTSTAAAGASTSNTHHAKPPTPPPLAPLSAPSPPIAPSAPASAPAGESQAQASATLREFEARPGLHSSSAPRDRRAPPELQLQSLHLSGFNFPLDALLAADGAESENAGDAKTASLGTTHAAATPPVPTPPVIPAATVDVQPPSSTISRRTGDTVPERPPGLSPPDPPASHSDLPSKPAASSSAPQVSNSSERPSAPLHPAFDIRPKPAPIRHTKQQKQPPPPPQQQQQSGTERSQKLHNVPRAFDLDHSLLSPESDTRYPIPRRRSPTNPSQPPARAKKSPSPPRMPRQTSPPPPPAPTHPRPEQSPYPHTHRGPIQGRPLIFAAMAAAEAEAEIIEPTAWMAITTLDSEVKDAPERSPMTERSDGSSHFVNGYPTPRSTSPKSPDATERRLKEDTSVPLVMGRSLSEPTADSAPAKAMATRRPSVSNLQSPPSVPTGLPTPPEPQSRPRARKLSKSRSRVTRVADASQQPPQPQAQPTTLGAKPPTPVDDAPPPPSSRVRDRDTSARHAHQSAEPVNGSSMPAPAPAPASALGSPINLRNEKPLPERRSAEVMRSPPPRVISSESPVPTRPVKVLTERQMEKLSATKGIAPNGTSAPTGPSSSARRRHEQPVPVSNPPPQAKSLPSRSSAAREERHETGTAGTRSMDGSAPITPKKKRPEETTPADRPRQTKTPPPQSPRSPVSPEEYARARSQRRGKALDKSRPDGIENVAPAADPIPEPVPDATDQGTEPALEPEEPKEPTFYPLEKHVKEPALLVQLLPYLAFTDWLALSSSSKTIRSCLYDTRELTELILERYLRTVGYSRWTFAENEPLSLTLSDLNAYMHGVSLPPHQFARYAETYLQTENRERNRKQRALIQSLQAACRSYTRVVLRLRVQAEADARANAATTTSPPTSPQRGRGLPSVRSTTSINNMQAAKKSFSRSSSRAPSPTSSFNHSHHGHVYGHARAPSMAGQTSAAPSVYGGGGGTFHSPLFRLRRAPLLQVFVPSPEGDWLSDASVLECEKELKRAGVVHLMRPGDVVWDTAVGDEGNVGRMVWDGGYLIDLDYTYSRVGDLPKYLPTLAFPPSYFHRVVRTMGSGNPVCHIDVAPWGEEIAANLQLIQDRVKTETPQGGHHMVVRWVHRSSFTIRPSASGKPFRLTVPRDVGPGPGPGGAWFVDPGWYGTVVVEAEGTNEGLADLQARCRGAFPPRAVGAAAGLSPERAAREEAQRSVFRILREKSRPGEIWIRTVTDKERLLPP